MPDPQNGSQVYNSQKQRQHRQGGEEYLSSRILQGPSREIQIDSRNESEAQCCAQIEVCDGCGVQGKREAESARIPAEQPGAKETSTTQDLLNQIGGISGHIRGTTREMPDLRIFRHEPAEDVPDSRSLSSFEESKMSAIFALYSWKLSGAGSSSGAIRGMLSTTHSAELDRLVLLLWRWNASFLAAN